MLVPMDERRLCVLLARTPGLTARHLHAVLARTRAGAAATEGNLAPGDLLSALRSAAELPARARAYLGSPAEPLLDADLRWLDASGAAVVPCSSPRYPSLLNGARGAPPVLYVLGSPGALAARHIAMVGTRAPTPAGAAVAREIAGDLARAGLCVASGLAIGIDAASHEGALDAAGMTTAVCAHGLDLVYPLRHRTLARRIREGGALISQFAPGVAPARRNFPWRGQLLSGLSVATLVIEAARHSGSLHTAYFAMQQGRRVLAVPGSVRNPVSAGCHELLRRGARVAENASDVLRGLGIPIEYQEVAARRSQGTGAGAGRAPLDRDSKILLDALGFEPVSLNTLVERTGLPSSGVTSMLLILELAGRVAPQPGGRWSRVC